MAKAFHAINVGPDWGAKPAPKPTPKPAPKPKPKPPTDPDPDPDPDPGPFAARIDLPAGNLTIPSGTVVAFGASARDSAPGSPGPSHYSLSGNAVTRRATDTSLKMDLPVPGGTGDLVVTTPMGESLPFHMD